MPTGSPQSTSSATAGPTFSSTSLFARSLPEGAATAPTRGSPCSRWSWCSPSPCSSPWWRKCGSTRRGESPGLPVLRHALLLLRPLGPDQPAQAHPAQAELEVQRQLRAKQQEQYELSRGKYCPHQPKVPRFKASGGRPAHRTGEEVREASLREIERSVMIYDAIVKTGNEVLDTVLTEKSSL